MTFSSSLKNVQVRIEQQLDEKLQQLAIAEPYLAKAMRYGVMNGGKRLRPFLVYATCEALGGTEEQADAAAVAIEMVHSYSLVHDDLPAMDDDELRRGKPTCHIAFDEATAILAGDGLLTAAFEVLVKEDQLSSEQRLKLIQLLSQASGGAGMVAGQSTDLNHVGKQMTLAELEAMHRNKTGALIRAAVLMGAICAQANIDAATEAALSAYAEHIGLAFQIWDDVLDVEGDTALLGKHQGKDEANNKPTYPALMGLAEAKAKAQALVSQAKQQIEQLNSKQTILSGLADYVVQRNY